MLSLSQTLKHLNKLTLYESYFSVVKEQHGLTEPFCVPRPVKFWERNYNTKRADNSNTRLSSQVGSGLGKTRRYWSVNWFWKCFPDFREYKFDPNFFLNKNQIEVFAVLWCGVLMTRETSVWAVFIEFLIFNFVPICLFFTSLPFKGIN